MAKASLNDPVNRGMLNEAVEAILNGIERMFKQQDDKYNKRFNTVETKIGQTKKELKDDIDGLKADLSDTPSRKQLGKLKARVDKFHPLAD